MNESEVVRDIATEATKTFLKEWLPQLLGALRRAGLWKRRHLLKELPARLRDCVADLRPCFARTGSTFLYVIWNSGLDRTQEWQSVHDRLEMAAGWFEGWDDMQRSVRESMTPEFFVRSLENLNRLLFWTSYTGEQLGKLVDQTPKNDLIRKPMHALVDKYNAFLTNYEAFLRRLPNDLGMRPLAPVEGMEAFFSRLRDPWSGHSTGSAEIDTNWARTCDPDIANEARDILESVKQEMDLLEETITIPAHGPTAGGFRPSVDQRDRLIRFRERVVNMLVSRQVLKSARFYGPDPNHDPRDGFVVLADREPVQRTLDALKQ